MKKLAIIAILLFTSAKGYSQFLASTSAYQIITLRVSDMMEFTFSSTGDEGNTVALPFNSLSDYKNGVLSAEQVLRIRCNNKFGIEVKASSDYFDYSGASSPAPTMPVGEVLNMEIGTKTAGSNLQAPFGTGKFVSVTESNKTILSDCGNGEQRFSIKYKASPGITYPIGNYSVDIIYTATQQ
jgi:hypothetical protein